MMAKTLRKIILILHLQKRWIRIMLTVSLLIILIVITIPVKHKKMERIRPLIYKVNDSIVVTNNAMDLRILRGRIDTVRLISNEFNVGDSFRFPWIQLWKSVKYFNNTGVWYRNYQRAAWVDDGETNYENTNRICK